MDGYDVVEEYVWLKSQNKKEKKRKNLENRLYSENTVMYVES